MWLLKLRSTENSSLRGEDADLQHNKTSVPFEERTPVTGITIWVLWLCDN